MHPLSNISTNKQYNSLIKPLRLKPQEVKTDQIAQEYLVLLKKLEPKLIIIEELKKDFRLFYNIRRHDLFENVINFLIPRCYFEFRALKPESYLIGNEFLTIIEKISGNLINTFSYGVSTEMDDEVFTPYINDLRTALKGLWKIYEIQKQNNICNSIKKIFQVTDLIKFLSETPEGKKLSGMKVEEIWKNPTNEMRLSTKELNAELKRVFDVCLFDFKPTRISFKDHASLFGEINQLLENSKNNTIEIATAPVRIARILKSNKENIEDYDQYIEHLRVLNSSALMCVTLGKLNRNAIPKESVRKNAHFIKNLLPLLLDFTHSPLPPPPDTPFKQEIYDKFLSPMQRQIEKFNSKLDLEICNSITKTAELVVKNEIENGNQVYYSYLIIKLFIDSFTILNKELLFINEFTSEELSKIKQSDKFLFKDKVNEDWFEMIETVFSIYFNTTYSIINELITFGEYFYEKEPSLPKEKKIHSQPLEQKTNPEKVLRIPIIEEPEPLPKIKMKTRPPKVSIEPMEIKQETSIIEEDDLSLNPQIASLLKGNLKYRKFVELLRSFNCTPIGYGKHATFQTAVGNKIPVPVHPGSDLKFGTAMNILKDAVKDFS